MSSIFFIVDEDLESGMLTLETHVAVIKVRIEEFLEQDHFIVSKNKHGNKFMPGFLAGIVLSRRNFNLKEQILDHTKKLFPYLTDDMILVPSISSIDSSNWIVQSIVSLAQSVATHAMQAEQEMAEMRILYENAQSAIFTIEREKRTAYTPKILFQALPGPRSTNISPGGIEITFMQEYPALHAIDIYIDNHSHIIADTDLIVELLGAQSFRSLAKWRIRQAEVHSGWNRFYCPLNHEPISENVSISIETPSKDTSFSVRYSNDENGINARNVRVRPENQKAISIRLWSGLVGVALPKTQPGHLVESEKKTNVTDASHAELLQLGSPLNPKDVDLVVWRDAQEGLLVHPRGVIPVIAQIPTLQVVNLSSIHLVFRLDHPEASPTDFTAWISQPSGTDNVDSNNTGVGRLNRFFAARRRADMFENEAIPKTANWTTLLGEQEGEIFIAVDPIYTGPIEIYLATRNHGPKNHFSWAVFTDISFDVSSS
jgi:hypothetical protein